MSFAEKYIPQNFALPNSLIYYTSHESGEIYKKLVICCKYFYLKYKIIPYELTSYFEDGKANKWGHSDRKNYDIIPSRIWIFNGDSFYFLNPIEISKLRPKIYRCDIVCLILKKHEYEFDDLKIIFSSKKFQRFLFFGNSIYSNGLLVPVETIFEAMPYVSVFDFDMHDNLRVSESFTSETAQKLAEMTRINKIRSFALCGVPENFNLKAFQKFVKLNASDNSEFEIGFFDIFIKSKTRKAVIAKFRKSFKDMVDTWKLENKKCKYRFY